MNLGTMNNIFSTNKMWLMFLEENQEEKIHNEGMFYLIQKTMGSIYIDLLCININLIINFCILYARSRTQCC